MDTEIVTVPVVGATGGRLREPLNLGHRTGWRGLFSPAPMIAWGGGFAPAPGDRRSPLQVLSPARTIFECGYPVPTRIESFTRRGWLMAILRASISPSVALPRAAGDHWFRWRSHDTGGHFGANWPVQIRIPPGLGLNLS